MNESRRQRPPAFTPKPGMEASMSKLIILTGKKFGKWEVIKRMPNKPSGIAQWLCRCECGVEKIIDGGSLRRGQSGGCASCRCAQKTHGHTANGKRSRTFRSWEAMKARCHDPKNIGYARYGGRGIQVCDRWRESFQVFLEDMGARPIDMSIDRIDNDGNYEPANCRWASRIDQARNKRRNRLITFRGKTEPLAVWAQTIGLSARALSERLRRGWSIEDAMTRPLRSRKSLQLT